MKSLKLFTVFIMFVGFITTKAQEALKLSINTSNGIIQKGQTIYINLRFTGASRESYENLVKKAIGQADFEIFGKGFNVEYAIAQLRFKSNTPKTLDEIEKLIVLLGFDKIQLGSKEININSLSQVYYINPISENASLPTKIQ
jgi:hypothetical protein